MKLLLFLILLTTSGLATNPNPAASLPEQQRKQNDPFILENEEKRARNPEGLLFTVRLKDDRKQFHLGEVITLELSFAASKPQTFTLDAATYDRSGRLHSDGFVLDQRDAVVDPLADYFQSGLDAFIMGGLRGIPDLTDKPYLITAELNEWQRIDKPGHYRLYVVSNRVSKKGGRATFLDNGGLPVVSNVIEFDILPADQKWAKQKLNETIAALSRPEGNHRAACRALRFIGTPAAVSEMRKRFRGDDNKCEWEYKFGLIGSPHRQLVSRDMEDSISSRDQPVTSHFISTLALLELTRRAAAAPPYPAENKEQVSQWQTQMERRRGDYKELRLHYLRQLVMAIPHKEGQARATSLQTLLDYRSELNTNDFSQWSTLLASIPEVFNRLPLDDQLHLLQYQWRPIASAAMLPVLREILKQPDNQNDAYQQRERRSIALRRLYELSPVEGRKLILDEIERLQPRVNRDVLRSLPDETLPELDDLLATNLEETRRPNRSGDVEMISDLIERYATAAILARVRAVYESPGVGKWACRIQASMLTYILRTDPTTGGELLSQALAARGKDFTRCYALTLTDVSGLHMSAEVEEIANAALEESDPEIVSQAASVLGQHGSAAAEERLWQRLQKWHDEMRSQAEALSKQKPGVPAHGSSDLGGQATIEQSLRNALSHGNAWLADLEKLKRLRALCLTDDSRREVDNMIRGWNQRIHVALNSFEDQPYSIRVAHYHLTSLKSLNQKLLQFPRGTLFTWGTTSSGDDDAKMEEVFKPLKSYLEERGMKLERGTSQ